MNIKEERQPWESDEHWVFREEFLLAHQGKFSGDRLLCLAQVFANVELLGCTYPAAVMRQVNELAKDITCLESIRKKRLDKATVKFVKASGDEPGNRTGNKRSGDSYGSQSKVSRSDNRPYNPSQHKNNRPGAAAFFQSQDDRLAGRHNAGETLSPQNSSISFNLKQHELDNRLNIANVSGERGHAIVKSADAVNVSATKEPEREPNSQPGRFVSSHDGHVRDMPIQTAANWMNNKKNKYGLNKKLAESLSVTERFQRLVEIVKDNFVKNVNNPIGLMEVSTSFCFMDLQWKTNPQSSSSNVTGLIVIDEVQIASGEDQNAKKCRFHVHKLAVDVLLHPSFSLVKDSSGGFMVSTSDTSAGKIAKYTNPIEKRFQNMSQILAVEIKKQPNVLQLIQVAAQRANLKIFFSIDEEPSANKTSGKKVNPTFVCKLFLEGVLTGQALGMSKKDARINAYNVAVSKLQEPCLKVINADSRLELVTSRTPLNLASAQPDRSNRVPVGKVDIAIRRQNETNMVNSSQAMEEMILISDLGIRESANHISVVRQSADFNRVPCEFKVSYVNQGNNTLTRFQVMIGGHFFGEGLSDNTKTAKLDAAVQAWQNLQRKFYTVQIKELICEEREKVSKSNLSTGGQSVDEEGGGPDGMTLSEDNIGFKMLRLMGWGGGGVGKKGNEGIVQPVSLKDVYKREGLGFSSEGRDVGAFRKGINEVIKNFVESGTCCDLAFTPEFSKEERMHIHRVAERYNLRNSSHGGKGPNRHVVLSRRFRPQQLLEHLMSSGGSTRKYDLIPPTG